MSASHYNTDKEIAKKLKVCSIWAGLRKIMKNPPNEQDNLKRVKQFEDEEKRDYYGIYW